MPLWFDKDPFNFWQDRLVYRNLEQLSVTEKTIDNAIYNYGQSSFRVWAFIHKVLRGESIVMIVIGGSAGGGISDHRQLYHQLFLQWWNNVILPHTGSKLTINNLSLGGTGSDFFSFCLQNYLLKCKEPDLVLIELSVNDYGTVDTSSDVVLVETICHAYNTRGFNRKSKLVEENSQSEMLQS